MELEDIPLEKKKNEAGEGTSDRVLEVKTAGMNKSINYRSNM